MRNLSNNAEALCLLKARLTFGTLMVLLLNAFLKSFKVEVDHAAKASEEMLNFLRTDLKKVERILKSQ